MPTLKKIFPEYIRLDGGTQPRVKIDTAVRDEYGDLMTAGKKFPPIDVFSDDEENYWLVDGFHRLDAFVLVMPGEAIECRVHKGTLPDAQWYSYSVNKTHGVRRTKKDIAQAVCAALAHPAAADKSNVQIAEHCGVDEKTVRKYRLANMSTSDNPKSDATVATSDNPKSRPRKGRDGRTINTAQIGGKKKKRCNSKPSRDVAARIAQPTRAPKPMDKMTAINMPHDPFMGAMTLIDVFDAEYLRKLVDTLSNHLKELQK